MNSITEPLRPLARQEELVIETLPDEVLIYDLKRDKAHCLSQTVATVWQHCNGQRSVTELAQAAQQQLHTPVEPDVVWFALDQLSKANLLEEQLERPATMQVTRRQLMRSAGALAAAAVVTTIVAPAAQAAVSCVGAGGNCSGAGLTCCQNLACTGGTCQ